MNIEKIYLIETVNNLHQEIKMFEKERELTDINRLDALYEIYYKAQDKLERM